MEKKRVNIVLDDQVHKESVKLAKSYGYDFSSFVNLMLDTVLYPVNIEGQEKLLTEMLIREMNRRGFLVTRGGLQLKGEGWKEVPSNPDLKALQVFEKVKKRKK